MRRAAKKDRTQAAIVAALRQVGVVVFVLNQEGLPDLLCYKRGRYLNEWLPLEVKSPGGQLTDAQQATQRLASFPVVDSVAKALMLFGVELS